MSFPRYPKYKASGVEWLGEVPGHWETIKLGRLLKVAPCYGVLVPDFEQDGVPMLRITDMENGNADRASLNTISQSLSAQYSRTIIEEGDVVLSVVGTIGEAFRVDSALAGVNLSRAVARLQLNGSIAAEFLCWIFQSLQFRRYVDLVCVGAAQRVLNMADLSAFRIVNPVVTEQTKIASFLDRETSKIDGLVGEQRRLIELLKEKRQAVISHAVTKGLNPHAPLKPSGIEWLGDVPEHWETRKLSHLFRAAKGKNGQMLTKEFCAEHPGEFPVYSGQTESEGLMGTWDQFEFNFGEEGVLFSTTVGSGKVMSLRHLFGKFSLSQNCMIIWPREGVCQTRFFYYHFQPLFDYERNLIPQHMQASFRMEDLYAYRIAVPPRNEQLTIATFLDAETAKFDALTAEAERGIELLQERRTALISAAVTGQIDVRGLVETGAA